MDARSGRKVGLAPNLMMLLLRLMLLVMGSVKAASLVIALVVGTWMVVGLLVLVARSVSEVRLGEGNGPP